MRATRSRGAHRLACIVVTLVPAAVLPQAPAPARGTVDAIAAPRTPLPGEAASAGVKRFSFIAYGDTRNSHDGIELQEAHGWVVESALRTIAAASRTRDPVRLVLQSGDAVVNGRDARQINVSFVPLINRFTREAGVSYFFSAGNHDVTGSQNPADSMRAVGLANLLSAHRNLLPAEGTSRRLAGYPAYAFGYGNTFFLAFDSQVAADSTQFDWVRAQLEGLDRRRYVNIVVFCHHPAYSSGPHGGPTLEAGTRAVRERYMPLFRRHHVKLMLVGHEHLFEHWTERYRDASGSWRLDQIVSGGGGAPIYRYSGEPDLSAYEAAGGVDHARVEHLIRPSADTTANPHHYLVVHVDGPVLRVEAVGVGWGSAFAPYPKGGLVLQDPRGRSVSP